MDDKSQLGQFIDKLLDKIGGPPSIVVAPQTTLTNSPHFEIKIENKSEVRLSLAELSDEIKEAVEQSSKKTELLNALTEEIKAVSNELAKESGGTFDIRHRLRNILTRSIQFARNAVDYGIKNGDKIIELSNKLLELINN